MPTPLWKNRRRPLRSRTLETFLHILSLCSEEDDHKSRTETVQVVADDHGPLASTDFIPNDFLLMSAVEESRLESESERPASSATDLMNSCPDPSSERDDVEEGEISWESMDSLSQEDKDPSLDQTNYEQDLIDETNLNPLSAVGPIDNVVKDMESLLRIRKRNLVDYSQVVVQDENHGGLEEGREEPALQGNASKNLAQNNKKRQGFLTEENRPTKKKKTKESVNPTDCSGNVDDSANKQDNAGGQNKKRKRVLTDESKAKKKRKERIKRAEKNRKLGVRRLKLEPVMVKEKKVVYCRHYLMGRCHEGDKCKFSHDTIPLTKSKPCCHFARRSCMKGDNCPFDHELKKYPCNNYVSKGFCSRGADCMFSHEAQASKTSLTASRESRPEPKSSSILDSAGSKMQTHVTGPYGQKVDGKFGSKPISNVKNTDHNLGNAKPKLASQPPKGICFLSQGRSSLGTGSYPKVEAGSSTKVDYGVKDTGITKTTTVVPRGINFLSFGKKPSLDDSSCSNLVNGIGKSPLSDLVHKSAKSVKVDSQISQSTPDDFNNRKKDKSDLLTNWCSASTPGSSLKPMLPSMSSSLQKSLQSTLAFASKIDSGIKTSGIVDSLGSMTLKA